MAAGAGASLALAMLGSTLSARQAQEWGLMWQLTSAETLQADAICSLKSLQKSHRWHLQRLKADHSCFDKSLHQQLAEERITMARLGVSEDFKRVSDCLYAKTSGAL